MTWNSAPALLGAALLLLLAASIAIFAALRKRDSETPIRMPVDHSPPRLFRMIAKGFGLLSYLIPRSVGEALVARYLLTASMELEKNPAALTGFEVLEFGSGKKKAPKKIEVIDHRPI